MIGLIKYILLFAAITTAMEENVSKLLAVRRKLSTKLPYVHANVTNLERPVKLLHLQEVFGDFNVPMPKSVDIIVLLGKLLLFDRLFELLFPKEVRALAMMNKNSMKCFNIWNLQVNNSNLTQRDFKKVFHQYVGTIFKHITEKHYKSGPFTIEEKDDFTKLHNVTKLTFDADFLIQLSPSFHTISFSQKYPDTVGTTHTDITFKNQNNGDFHVETTILSVLTTCPEYSTHAIIGGVDYGSHLWKNCKIEFKREENSLVVNLPESCVQLNGPIGRMKIEAKPVFNTKEELMNHVLNCV